MAAPVLREHWIFSGLVQGVGFRWRARKAAEAAGVTGWVRNDLSGTVSLELQGSREQIDRVLRDLERGRWIRIEERNVRSIPPDPEERSFRALDDFW